MRDGFLAIPDDTVWMRAGRPFTAGEADWDSGMFPPTPWSWQGMVRTRILVAAFGEGLSTASRSEIEHLVGPPDALPGGWVLRGPLPARRSAAGVVEPWVPWPRFLSRASESAPPVRAIARELDGWEGSSTTAEGPLLTFPAGRRAASDGWISATNLRWAMLAEGRWDPAGSTSAIKRAQGGADLPPFVAEEPRTGIAIDDVKGRVQEHMLYTAVHHRFAPDSGLWGMLEGAPREAEALTTERASLGRKGRTVALSSPPLVPGFADLLRGAHLPVETARHLRVVLLTPAWVTDAPQPFALPESARVRGQQAGRGPDIGGFDRIGGGGRAARATWAAGSWWWIELTGQTPELRRDAALALTSRPENLTRDDERFGFGLRVVAPFDPEHGEPLKESPHG